MLLNNTQSLAKNGREIPGELRNERPRQSSATMSIFHDLLWLFVMKTTLTMATI